MKIDIIRLRQLNISNNHYLIFFIIVIITIQTFYIMSSLRYLSFIKQSFTIQNNFISLKKNLFMLRKHEKQST